MSSGFRRLCMRLGTAASLSDQPTDVANGHAEVLGHVLDRQEDGQLVDGVGS